MATFTNPGSRVDLLLTLARLSFPDAVRRANQPVAVSILIACSVTAIGLLAQVALRAPVTWLLDLEDLLRLPVGFRDLYGLRFGLSTIGYWLFVLGPAAAYLTVMRSGGVAGAPVTLLGILSLVWIFGRLAAILSLLAHRWVEGALGTLAMLAIMVAFALVWAPTLAGLAVGMAGLFAVALHGFRVEKQPPTCYVWRESLPLPLSVQRIFRAPGRAPNVVILFVVALILGLTSRDWFGWPFFVVAACLMLAGVLLGTAAYGLIQLHWPQRSAGFADNPNAAKFGASLLLPQLAFGPALLTFVLYMLSERQRVSPLTAGLIAVAVLLLAALAAYGSRRWQARVLRARGRELLLDNPAEDPPKPSSPPLTTHNHKEPLNQWKQSRQTT